MPAVEHDPAFPAGGGEMGALIRANDWSTSPFGLPEGWPQSLRSALQICLNMPMVSAVHWGPDLRIFYNDAYAPALAERHPWALGRPFSEVWAEIWNVLGPQIASVVETGHGFSTDRQLLKMDRHGRLDDTYWIYSFAPLRSDDGAVAGIFVTALDETDQVLAERRQAFMLDLGDRLRTLDDAGAIMQAAAEALGRQIGADRAGYAEVTADDQTFVVERDWSGGDMASFVGRHRLDDFGPELIAAFRAGHAVSFEDVLTEPLTAGEDVAGAFETITMRAAITVPLIKSGRFAAALYAHSRSPRRWTQDDESLVREVAERTSSAVERARAEAELRESEAAARVDAQRVQLALAAGAIIGTWFWDIPIDCFTADEPFARAFGLDPVRCREGIQLADIFATVHPDDQTGLADAIEAATIKGGPYAHQYRVRRADGKYYWIEANGHVDLGPDGTPLSFPGVLIDVEGRRAVEAERDRATAALLALNETLEQRVAERTTELEAAHEQLRQSQKMEAVGQLTGGLAHDFNNLLTGIMGNLELLQTRVAVGRFDSIDRFINAAQGAGRRAAALTHRLLAFSRQQTLDPKPTDVNRLIAGMEELIRRSVGPAVDIEVVGAAGLWLTLIDAGQLENALLNLAINGRDAMPDGGRLTIETANKWLDGRTGRERDLPPGQYLSICVTDTGAGMTPEVIARAFDPFYTTKPLGEGTGLGLSMIYGFARQSGGQIRIYSEVGAGTTMCIYLPRHVGDELEDAGVAESVDALDAANGETILVIDDEPTIRHLIDEVLDEQGYTVIGAADGAAGLKVLQSGARIELLITDVGLPGGMNGRQVADAARVLRPGLKVLFITGYAENAAVGNGLLDSGMELLTKPFSLDDLARRVRDLITKRV